MAKYKISMVERLKALKIKESDFFFLQNHLHVSLLSDQFCIYMLKLRFLLRGSQITDGTPLPSLSTPHYHMPGMIRDKGDAIILLLFTFLSEDWFRFEA